MNTLTNITKKSIVYLLVFSLLFTCYGITSKSFAASGPYTVEYVSIFKNDNSKMASCKTDTSGSVTLSKNQFVRNGFSFIGWSKSPYGEIVYKDGDKVKISEDTTLYARWKVNDVSKVRWGFGYRKIYDDDVDHAGEIYSAEYYNDGGKVTFSNDFPYTGYENRFGVLLVHDKNGVASQEWCSLGDLKSNGLVMHDDVRIYIFCSAKNSKKNFFVYNPGNSATGAMIPEALRDGDQLSPNAYYRPGYKFAGWATSQNGSVVYKDCAEVNQNGEVGKCVNLYPKWTLNTYSITFNANGGTGTMSKQSIKHNTATALKANTFKRTNYKFKGWAISKSGSVKYADKAKVKLTSNTTLYAQWDRIKYTVTFNKNGGTGTMSKQTFSAGSSQALSANKFTKKGYKFKGWATSKSGKVVYKNKQSIKATKNMTLYAVWKK